MDDKAAIIEDRLISEAIGGSEQAYKKLYDSYKKNLFLVCLRYAANREEAEDMLQDGFVTIFKELHQFDRNRGSFYSWANRVVINTNLQNLRKRKLKFDELVENESTLNKLTEDFDVISNMELKEMVLHLQKMPTGYRTVFNLYNIEGYSHKEISEKLGITESTSRTQLMKSKEAAKNILVNKMEITR